MWDDELAAVAQAHADQCQFEHDCAACRRVDRSGQHGVVLHRLFKHESHNRGPHRVLMLRFGVGQNLFIYKQSMRLPARDWGRAVTDWYDEVTLFSNKKVDLRHVTRDT